MDQEYEVWSCCMDPNSADYGRGGFLENCFPTLSEAVEERDAIRNGDGHPAAWIECNGQVIN